MLTNHTWYGRLLRNFFPITPKRLAYWFALLGVIFTLITFRAFQLVFQGDWKVNQQLKLFSVESLDLFGVIIPIGDVSIRFYSICILLGTLSGYALTLYLAKRRSISASVIDRLFIGLIISGLLGARLFYVLFNYEQYSINPTSILLELNQGGLAVFGMLLAGITYLWIQCKRYRFHFYELLDILTPGVLLGQIIGRFGNFFNYESYGAPTSVYWKMYVPQTANIYQNINERFFHPTFLYEIIPNFLLLIFIMYKYNQFTARRSGLVFSVYAMGYGVTRFITEFYRLDALKIDLPFILTIGPFSTNVILISQITAALLATTGLIIYLRRDKIIFSQKHLTEVRV